MKQTPTFAARLLMKSLFLGDSPACSKRSRAAAVLHMAMSSSDSSSSHWQKTVLYVTAGLKSSLQSWILDKIKSLRNLWNRFFYYWFTTPCSITFYLWGREQKDVCLPGVPGRPRACSMAAGQSLNRELFQIPEPHLCSLSKQLLHFLGVFPPMGQRKERIQTRTH